MTDPQSIDPRGPRVSAGITAVVVLVVIALALAGLFWPASITRAPEGFIKPSVMASGRSRLSSDAPSAKPAEIRENTVN